MTRAVVIYHFVYGNTRAIATRLVEGLEENSVDTTCVGIDGVDFSQLADYDFVAIGGSKHNMGPSRRVRAALIKHTIIP